MCFIVLDCGLVLTVFNYEISVEPGLCVLKEVLHLLLPALLPDEDVSNYWGFSCHLDSVNLNHKSLWV